MKKDKYSKFILLFTDIMLFVLSIATIINGIATSTNEMLKFGLITLGITIIQLIIRIVFNKIFKDKESRARTITFFVISMAVILIELATAILGIVFNDRSITMYSVVIMLVYTQIITTLSTKDLTKI